MDFYSFPAFGETEYCAHFLSDDSRVVLMENASLEMYDRYCQLLEQKGFARKEQEEKTQRSYSAW